MQQEEKAESSVPWSIYGAYVGASGSLHALLVLAQGANLTTSLWLSYWMSRALGLSDGQYMGAYAGLGALQALLIFLFSVLLSVVGTRATMAFFDTTPLGRITNRFSCDVDVMDNNLTDAMHMFLFTLSMVTAVFALVVAYFHFFAVALAPLYALFLLAAAYFLTFANQRWLSIRLDCIGNALVFTVGILIVTSRFNVDPSIGGLVLSYILSIVQMLQFSVRQLTEVENGMNAVERLRYYGVELPAEAPLHTIAVRTAWPQRGEIVFDGVEMRYRDALPLILRGLSLRVGAGERIAIVGRTGAGKSSIASTLFRLVELSAGSIAIDGLDITTLGLQDLRSRLAIIPQDLTLFRGTVRSNLDPFDEQPGPGPVGGAAPGRPRRRRCRRASTSTAPSTTTGSTSRSASASSWPSPAPSSAARASSSATRPRRRSTRTPTTGSRPPWPRPSAARRCCASPTACAPSSATTASASSTPAASPRSARRSASGAPAASSAPCATAAASAPTTLRALCLRLHLHEPMPLFCISFFCQIDPSYVRSATYM